MAAVGQRIVASSPACGGSTGEAGDGGVRIYIWRHECCSIIHPLRPFGTPPPQAGEESGGAETEKSHYDQP